MYYIIDIAYLPDEIITEIQSYLSVRAAGFLFIRKNDLNLHSSYILSLDEGYEFIDIEKLKEILLTKHLRS